MKEMSLDDFLKGDDVVRESLNKEEHEKTLDVDFGVDLNLGGVLDTSDETLELVTNENNVNLVNPFSTVENLKEDKSKNEVNIEFTSDTDLSSDITIDEDIEKEISEFKEYDTNIDKETTSNNKRRKAKRLNDELEVYLTSEKLDVTVILDLESTISRLDNDFINNICKKSTYEESLVDNTKENVSKIYDLYDSSITLIKRLGDKQKVLGTIYPTQINNLMMMIPNIKKTLFINGKEKPIDLIYAFNKVNV